MKNNELKLELELKVGDVRQFFHPKTMGVMHYGEVLEIGKFSYRVKFWIDNRTFWTYKEFN